MRTVSGGLLFSLVVVAQSCSDRCTGNFAELTASCPRSFDGTAAAFPACEPGYAYVSRRCGDLIAFQKISLSGMGCYYDAVSHQLVGATAGSDVRSYCDQSSNTISAGRVSDSCDSEPIATKDCVSQP